MLYRKIQGFIEEHFKSGSDKILVLEGARQTGKSYIIRNVGKRLFRNYIEINFAEDDLGAGIYRDIRTTDDFYLSLSVSAGGKLGTYADTLVFLDEIQQYPQYLGMLKFLREDRRYRFVASGSLLGIALRSTASIPVGSIIRKQMHQLDLEEFLIACGVGEDALSEMRRRFAAHESLGEAMHQQIMQLFRRYLLVGGMPDAVNEYLATHNIVKVREVQNAIRTMYAEDASKYEHDNGRNLLIRRIFDLIPSQMENKKKRIVAKNIRGKEGERFDRYTQEFEYLISSGITAAVHAIANPKYPLSESVQKNLIKLYPNDVGLLTAQLYGSNLSAVLNDESSVNLGAVYENVVATELKAHGHRLFYYDNRQRGEVDFIVDDNNSVSVLPIEVKSGKDYTVHSALNRLLATPDYGIHAAIVLSNAREVRENNGITYFPIYYAMFIGEPTEEKEEWF